jgi:hypothetical protein
MDLSNMLPLSVVSAEVLRITRGESTRVPISILCESLAHYLIFLAALLDPDEAERPNDGSLAFLNALYQLKDPRPEAAHGLLRL